jgi:phosphoserine phosphatase
LLITRTVVFLVLLTLVVMLALGRPPLDASLFAVALAVGLMPEFLPMIVTITLAQGALRMARQRVLVKSLPAIENLGSVDIVCSDKTGTLTLGEMQLVAAVDLHGHDWPRGYQLGWLNARTQSGLASPFDRVLLARDVAEYADVVKLDELPFDFERRRVSVVVQVAGRVPLLVTKGAPETILPLCTAYEDEEGVHSLDEPLRAQAAAQFRQLSAEGLRVLAVAWRHWEAERSIELPDESDLVFAGFLAFADPPLPEAAEAIRQLAADGVRIKLLTGDNELVTAAVCRAVGLPAERIVLGSELERLDPLALERLVEEVDAFARVTPAQKRRIVLTLKAWGHAVAFLGDGINDAPSLHAADVGISVMNAVDIAREAADIVLLDRRLSTLHEGIMEGRRAFSSVMTFLLMETSSNFGNVFSMAGAAAILPFLPMLPHQILLNNFLYDLAQIAIPRDRVDPILTASPRRWDIGFVRAAMLVLGPISSLFDFLTFAVLLALFHADERLFHSGWFVESLVTQCLVVFVIRTARAPWRARPSWILTLNVLAIVGIGLALPFSPFADVLGFVQLPPSLSPLPRRRGDQLPRAGRTGQARPLRLVEPPSAGDRPTRPGIIGRIDPGAPLRQSRHSKRRQIARRASGDDPLRQRAPDRGSGLERRARITEKREQARILWNRPEEWPPVRTLHDDTRPSLRARSPLPARGSDARSLPWRARRSSDRPSPDSGPGQPAGHPLPSRPASRSCPLAGTISRQPYRSRNNAQVPARAANGRRQPAPDAVATDSRDRAGRAAGWSMGPVREPPLEQRSVRASSRRQRLDPRRAAPR